MPAPIPQPSVVAVDPELLGPAVGALRYDVDQLKDQLADLDGDGRPDLAAAAPRLRAVVVVALAGLGLVAYGLTPVEGRALRELLLYLAALALMGVGEAALIGRLVGQRGQG